jgi:hypothetical protein
MATESRQGVRGYRGGLTAPILEVAEPSDAREAAFAFLDDGWVTRAARVILDVELSREARLLVVLSAFRVMLRVFFAWLRLCHVSSR